MGRQSFTRRWAISLTATLIGIPVALAMTPALTTSTASASMTPAVSSDWTVYHADPAGSGVDQSGASFTNAGPVWTSAVLDGELYGEPIEDNGLVIAATENDTVYALDVNTGAVVWQTHVGTAVPASSLPCGDIVPTVGITSTPVIDPSRSEVFVVADETTGFLQPAHHLVGLDLATGNIELDQVVDPPGSFPIVQLQRPALTLDQGQVIVAYGGNAGDCETPQEPYHGWVVAAPETGGSLSSFEVAANPGDSQGAIWMGGAAPVVDASGNIWVATGNSAFTVASDAYDDSDGVLELSPSLTLEQSFAPSTWYSDNAHDFDLGSVAPALMDNGLAFQAGKSETGYLLSQSDLGGVGGQLVLKTPYCGGVDDGGSAVVGNIVYSPCFSGVVATQISSSPPGISVLWKTPTASGGPPIVAGGLVWTISQSGYLYGLNPSTGLPVEFFSIGTAATHFPTPSVADGMLLAPSSDQIHAFAAGTTNNPPGNLVLYKSTALVGNLIDRVGGTGWNNNGDGSVDIYQCASPTYATGSCSGLLATANVAFQPSNLVGHFPLTSFKVIAGTVDPDGDTCGIAGSVPCYVVVVGSNGDQNSLALHFASPVVSLQKSALVVGNTLDTVRALHFPIGDTVMAEQCDAAVNPASPGGNCDSSTSITGHANITGTVVFVPNGIRTQVGTDYQDTALGTCNPGAICTVVVSDETDPLIFVKENIGFARPSVTLTPALVPNANGETMAVTAKNFPVGETVQVDECDTAFTPGSTDNCDTATQMQGVANALGTVSGVAWTPTIKMPVYTTATATAYSDVAGGSCAPGDTVGDLHPCHVGSSDTTNSAFLLSTPFGVS